ncbi:MAG: glycosyltransferase family 4 protein [Candidatus Bipolaricaulota bacterium]|nr:glycosyltransferase family 4 protein [Candidatus Bipolaricaulota bacterium]
MMRILFWSAAFWPGIGGVQSVGGRLVRSLSDRGHTIHVVAEQTSARIPLQETHEGVAITRLPLTWRERQGLDAVADVVRTVREVKTGFQPDLVHIHGTSDSDFFHHATASAHRAPLLVTLHGLWPRERQALVRRTLEAADWVVGCSQAVLDEGRRLVPAIATRSCVLYAGTMPPVTPSRPLPFDPPRLLFLGRLSPEKGADLALEAFAHVAERVPALELLVAGDGGERGPLERRAAELGLSEKIRFLGWVDPKNVSGLLNRVTLVLVPSRQEAFGQAALEAATVGRPVVASAVGGLPEIVRHRETGLLLDSRSAQTWADEIVRLLECPEAVADMGRRAQADARTRFDWTATVDATEALYVRMVQAFAEG